MAKFVGWLQHEAEAVPTLEALAPAPIRAFLTYLREERPDGRFASAASNVRHAARPSTVHTYYRCLRAFVKFCLAEGLLDETPLKNVKAPRVPNDQVQPLSADRPQRVVACRPRGTHWRIAAVCVRSGKGSSAR
jgi:site-specific recombinase XerD